MLVVLTSAAKLKSDAARITQAGSVLLYLEFLVRADDEDSSCCERDADLVHLHPSLVALNTFLSQVPTSSCRFGWLHASIHMQR